MALVGARDIPYYASRICPQKALEANTVPKEVRPEFPVPSGSQDDAEITIPASLFPGKRSRSYPSAGPAWTTLKTTGRPLAFLGRRRESLSNPLSFLDSDTDRFLDARLLWTATQIVI
jgi:hypothetical protein